MTALPGSRHGHTDGPRIDVLPLGVHLHAWFAWAFDRRGTHNVTPAAYKAAIDAWSHPTEMLLGYLRPSLIGHAAEVVAAGPLGDLRARRRAAQGPPRRATPSAAPSIRPSRVPAPSRRPRTTTRTIPLCKD